jgi:hypothetical protein
LLPPKDDSCQQAKSVTLHQVPLRYMRDFLTQTTQTALATRQDRGAGALAADGAGPR